MELLIRGLDGTRTDWWHSALLLTGAAATDPPGMYLVEGPDAHVTYVRWLAAAAVVAGSLVLNGTWLRQAGASSGDLSR